MKTRVGELNVHRLYAETRPYRIMGWQEGVWAIEYLDVYEYSVSWQPDEVEQKEKEGWGIVNSMITGDGDQHWLLRRVKPESEVSDD